MNFQSIIKGAIKIQGLPEEACFTSFKDLLQALETYAAVEIGNQSFSNVVISPSQPGLADKTKIWWRTSFAGGFIGLYQFIPDLNTWVQVYPAPSQIFWLAGDSDNPPDGFKLLEASDGLLTSTDYETLMNAQAIPAGLTPPYRYYPAIFEGF